MKKIFYIGWIGYNNIGDELMFDIFNNLYKTYIDTTKYQLIPSYPGCNIYDIDKYDVIVLGGGSILIDGYIDILYNAVKKDKKVIVWGSGYDWIEKDLALDLDACLGPLYLLPEGTELKLQEIINNSKFFGIRGPLTYKLLANSFIDTTNVIISGDPGFLLKPEELDKDIDILKFNEHDKVVGINWGTCLNRVYGKNEKYVEDALVSVCKRLLSKGYKLYLYTMWDSDIKHLKNLYSRINDNQNVILDTKLHPAGQVLNILKRCHFTINLKLHANIISSVANTPFICLGYRFKTIDFTKSINCEELLVLTDEENIDHIINSKIKYIENNYSYVKAKLKLELGKYNNILESLFRDELYK